MISIVCVYNNPKTLEECLLYSLKKQHNPHELTIIDNTGGEFNSAAVALNKGAKKATSDYIMFVHQDIILTTNTWLEDIEKTLNSLSNLGVAGVAGRQERTRFNTASVTHGIPAKFVGREHLTEPVKVQTLDECLLIIPQKVFQKLKFDSEICDDWHLYGVDYCLNAQSIGLTNYVLPTSTYHKSLGRNTKSVLHILLGLGSLPKGYVDTAAKVLAKHKQNYKKIYTVCGTWSTSCPFMIQRIINIPKDIARHLYWQYRQLFIKDTKQYKKS